MESRFEPILNGAINEYISALKPKSETRTVILSESVTIYFGKSDSPAEYDCLKKLGFENDGTSGVSKGPYKKGFLEYLKLELTNRGLCPEIFHSIYPTYDSSDFKNAPLLCISFPDYDALNLNFCTTCDACGAKRIEPIFRTYTPKALSHSHIYDVGVGAKIVSKHLRAAMEKITGIEFEVFDEAQTYYFIKPTKSLGPLVIHSDECKGYNGSCPKCHKHRFQMYFGIEKHDKGGWNGEDVINGGILDIPVFSHAAFAIIKSFEPKIYPYAPILLE